MSEANLSFPETERLLASDSNAGSLVPILVSIALFILWMAWFASPSQAGSGPSAAETVLGCASGASLR
jgi:hypothetical protein